MVDRTPPSAPRSRLVATRPRLKRAGRALRPLRHLLTLTLLVLVFGAGVAVDRVVLGGADGRGADGRGAGAAQTGTELEDAEGYEVLAQTWEVIQDQYVDLENVDEEALFWGASQGMVEALGDTGHSRFLTPEEAEAFERAINSEAVGIGVYLSESGGQVIVGGIVEGGPADEAEVRRGDVILSIDNEDVVGETLDEVSDALRGEEGEDVALTLFRPSEGDEYEVALTRRTIAIEPVSWAMLPDGIAFVRISEFSAGATEGLRDAIAGAEREGAVGMVLDLRDNPGGLVFEAVGVASQFMEPGTVIFQQQGRDGEPVSVETAGDGDALELPLTVLVNGGSASAAEIVGGALRDNGRATLIGQETFGTGTILSPVSLDDGSLVVIGSQLWLTADGESVWREGVQPDEEVALPYGDYPAVPGDDEDVTAAEFRRLEDDQLKAAHADVAERIEEAAD